MVARGFLTTARRGPAGLGFQDLDSSSGSGPAGELNHRPAHPYRPATQLKNMKNLIIGLALAATCFACAANDSTQVEDASSAAAPASECCAESGECSGADAAACASKSKCLSEGAKSECSAAEAAECTEGQKTCPVTGQVIEG
jgi:hypothetical protein